MVCPKFVLVVPVAARYRSPTIIKILGFKAKSETFFFFSPPTFDKWQWS